MSNSYFKFKQFTIEQDACAMKVCTDACVFGAWLSTKLQLLKTNNLLDIGTGTGVLSLMIAQNNQAPVDAIEIDEAASKQAGENFASSPWSARLHVVNADIRKLVSTKKYEFIFSNPPFFDNDLKSTNTQRNTALHSANLSATELIESIRTIITEDGYLALLLPPHRVKQYEELALENGLFIVEKVAVKQTENHAPFREMLLFSKTRQTVKKSEIIIKVGASYSTSFFELLKDYYLYM